MATASMKSFNDVMLKSNTTKFISIRLEVRTYVKSTPSEWAYGVNYKAGQIVKISDPIIRYFRCLEQHLSSIENNPTIESELWFNLDHVKLFELLELLTSQ